MVFCRYSSAKRNNNKMNFLVQQLTFIQLVNIFLKTINKTRLYDNLLSRNWLRLPLIRGQKHHYAATCCVIARENAQRR